MTPKTSDTRALSLIIPTRERSAYLGYAIQTCTLNPSQDLEILVLDNASTDNTREVVAAIHDPRIRYVRNDCRLSMRDNFEKGLQVASGEIICFIGDDDGIFPDTVDRALKIFDNEDIYALSAMRAHYFWPDLTTKRRNIGLVPRNEGIEYYDSKAVLKNLLNDNDYYRLPCLYHGFVRRAVVERIRKKHGRFFLSSQVDMYSAIAISMENIRYAFSKSPLIINGGSARSNGASHFGGGTGVEKQMWKIEDDIGFLPGFSESLTIASLIIESAIRYGAANDVNLADILNIQDCASALRSEELLRIKNGRGMKESEIAFITAGIDRKDMQGHLHRVASRSRFSRLIRSFLQNQPIDMKASGVANVYQAAQLMSKRRANRQNGFFYHPFDQLRAAAALTLK